ncbi:MAG TPA: class I SAM-dependent methyltransferase [Bacteroidota bacterium]|nr:class I SAM-dependent methyltransferase [Bacteroidota bacterium]
MSAPAHADRDRVTEAWGKIYVNHPGMTGVARPESIARVRKQDFVRILQRYADFNKNLLVLEAGCGRGIDSLYCASRGSRVVALDRYLPPLAGVETARRRYEATSSQQLSLSGCCGDFFRLSFMDNTFDVTFNSGVIEHFSAEADRVAHLTELARVVKPGGIVAVAFPNKAHPLAKWWETLASRFSDFDSYEIPEQPITADAIHSAMESAGLRDTAVHGIDAYNTFGHYPHWLPLRTVSYALRTLLPAPPESVQLRFGVRLLAIGKK